ncbi:MAG: S8 family serine peptidase [Holophagales bacterium]|nr:S8 family serine peptidase [Holophagales bacterium]
MSRKVSPRAFSAPFRSDDPRDQGGYTPLEDPKDQGGYTPLEDPKDQGGHTPLEDPKDQGGHTPLEDPDWIHGSPGVHGGGARGCGCGRCRSCCCACRPPRRRAVPYRHRGRGPCGELPSAGGSPGVAGRFERRLWSGQVVVRLEPEYAHTAARSLRHLAAQRQLDGLLALLEEYEVESSPPLVRPCHRDALQALEEAARVSDFPPLQPLGAYWRLDARRLKLEPRAELPGAAASEAPDAGLPRAEELVERLNDLFEVGNAYLELAASDPFTPVDPGDDPHAAGQGYLDPAPLGIDARFAWAQDQGRGEGISVVDLEQGWLAHEDVIGQRPVLVHGDNRHGVGSYVGHHGSAVLGELVGVDNAVGVVGVAPGVASVRLASHFDFETSTSGQVAEAIVAAIGELEAGDVLLLEVQKAFLPTEVDEADFHAIRLACAQGIVVVEAAGNAGFDLDAYVDPDGDPIFDRRRTSFVDSGAILVGAAEAAVPHDRLPSSNHGSRLDCYAWGERVVSAGYGDLEGIDPRMAYTAEFANTSAAAPIVAGAAALVQGRYRAATGSRLSPLQMRALLSDPGLGTPQGRGRRGRIGVMPDLRAVLERGLGVTPRLVMRDRPGCEEAGSGRVVGASIDLIVAARPAASAAEAYGAGSAVENLHVPVPDLGAGKDTFVYARLANHGTGAAPGVRVSLFQADVATLLTPDRWRPIGVSAPVDVPQGGSLVVTEPVRWAAAEIPHGGHASLVALAHHPRHPAPPLPAMSPPVPGSPAAATAFDWGAFLDLVQSHPNIAFRNRHTVALPPATEQPVAWPFLLNGSPAGDRERLFALEVVQALPAGARVWLEVPALVAAQLARGRGLRTEPAGRGRVRLRLPSLPRLPFCWLRLAAGAEHPCRFLVEGPESLASGGHGLTLRQLYRGREVGRIRWDFVPR